VLAVLAYTMTFLPIRFVFKFAFILSGSNGVETQFAIPYTKIENHK